MSVACKSTRYGQGCGHPVEDHTGPDSPQDCCCCNGQHNDPTHVRDCIECHRRRYGKPGMTAGEFEQYLPDHLKGPYWRQKLIELLVVERGYDPDADS